MRIEDVFFGGVSASFATLFTNPVDSIKIRMQMKGIIQSNEESGKEGNGYSNFYRYNVRRQMYLVTKRRERFIALQVNE